MTVQFGCCGMTNFTDWGVANLVPFDEDSVASNSSSSSSGVHGNGSWSLTVPDSCCVEVLEHPGCGWSVMSEAGSRLNNIHTEARPLLSSISRENGHTLKRTQPVTTHFYPRDLDL